MQKKVSWALFGIVFIVVGLPWLVVGVRGLIIGYDIKDILPLIFSTPVTLLGLSPLFLIAKEKVVAEKLTTNGELIYADILEVKANTFLSFNGIHPYIIYCKWNSHYNGKEYIFKSRNLWYNPKEILETKSIKQMPVYITREKIKPYEMDLSILQNGQ